MKKQTENGKEIAVSAITLQRTTRFESQRKFTGQAEAQRRSNLGFERIGRIEKILVDVGDEVVKGQIVASLDCDALKAQRRKSESELKSVQAKLREAKAGPRVETIAAAQAALDEQNSQLKLASESLLRRQRLQSKKLVSMEELDQATANAERWKASVEGASQRLKELREGTRPEQIDSLEANEDAIRAGLEQIDIEIEKSTLRSPFEGKILARNMDEGSVIAPGQSVLAMIEYKALEAKIGVPHAFIKGIAKGQTMKLECNDQLITGTVSGIVAELDVSTRTQPVIFKLDSNAWEDVVVGDTISAIFTQEKQINGFWVPTESLTSGPRGLWNCFVLENVGSDGVGTASMRTVEVIHSAGDRSLISGPIDENEILVSTAPHRIIAGQRVTPQFKSANSK